MAYDKEQIIKQAIQVIEDEECVTVEEISLYLPISLRTFYDWNLQELQEIKDALNAQKVKQKKKMRRKWRNSENPALQIAEYKLMATDEEIEKITMSRVKQDTNLNVSMPTIKIEFREDDKGD